MALLVCVKQSVSTIRFHSPYKSNDFIHINQKKETN